MTTRLLIPVAPVPASRPRVSRWGTYYGKVYSRFRIAMKREVPAVLNHAGVREPYKGPITVSAWFWVQRPKSTKLRFPKGDVDNYVKGLFDSLNGLAWVDDTQIVGTELHKRFAPPGKAGWMDVEISPFQG